MNSKVACAIAFVTGAAIGVAGTWKIVKTKYERIAQEEIESVREVFSRRRLEEKQINDEPEPEPSTTDESSNPKEYWEQYDKLAAQYDVEEKGETMAADKPYIIAPEEFGENGYFTESLTYYADGILTDFTDNIIENVDEVVGADAFTHFGEYEDDSVFVRNDKLHTDYEILRDLRNFEDVVGVE